MHENFKKITPTAKHTAHHMNYSERKNELHHEIQTICLESGKVKNSSLIIEPDGCGCGFNNSPQTGNYQFFLNKSIDFESLLKKSSKGQSNE